MSLFTPIATFTLSDQWQFTDVLVGSYFRVVHLTQPLNQDGQLEESSAAIAQADITGFIYTQDDFSHQTDPQSFILEQPDSLEVRTIGFRLLPNQTPWQIRVEALDATRLPSAGGYSVDAIDDLLALKANVSAVYTKAEVDALLALKKDKVEPPPPFVRPSAMNLLAWTLTQAETYSYASGDGLDRINDTFPTSGAIKTGGGTPGKFKIFATFSAPVYLNKVRLLAGSYQGAVDLPDSMEIRNPSTDELLWSSATSGGNWQEFLLSDASALDTPLNQYLIVWSKDVDRISIMELELYGVAA